jgi:hypothetical protein
MSRIPRALRSVFSGEKIASSRQLVFMAINKTGSSSVWTWMDDNEISYHMNRYQENEARKLGVIREAKQQQLPCFTIVRNPWERAVSSWKWCMLKKGLAACTFEDFLQVPFERMTEQQRFHTTPQFQHVVDESGSVDYLDHIGRLESIDETCDWVTSTLGVTAVHELTHLKKTDHASYAEYYSDKTIELVAKTFHEDVVLFDYEFGS